MRALILLLLLLLCLLSSQAWATTYYVRPTAQGAGDGLAYTTAASPTAIDYTAMIAGDTVKACGAFVAANKDTRKGGAAMMSVTAPGVIVDGDCSASGDLAQATMDGGSTVPYGVYCETEAECQDQTWTNIKVTNLTTRGFYPRNGTTVADAIGFTGTNLDCEDIVSASASGQWCVAGYGSGATLAGINSLRTTDDAVHWEGSNFTITDSTLLFPGYGTATGVFIGDCVQNITATDGAIMRRNYCDKRNANADGNVAKSCFVIGDPATGTSGEISDNVCYLPTTGNSVFQSKPILVSTSTAGVKILRNYIYGGYYGIFSFQSGGTIAGNIVSHTEAEGISVPTSTTGGTHDVYNNIVDTSNICFILKSNGSGSINAYNNLAMNCTTYGYEKVSLVSYVQSNNRCDLITPTCSNNAGTITAVDPGLVGGQYPGVTTASTTVAASGLYRPRSGSALRGGGKDLNVGNVQDCANRAFKHPPSIGACEAASGDARANAVAR